MARREGLSEKPPSQRALFGFNVARVYSYMDEGR